MLALQTELTLLFIIVHIGVVLLLIALALPHLAGRRRFAVAAGLGGWLLSCLVLTLSGVTADFSSLFSPLSMAMTTPVIIGLLLIWRLAWLRQLIAALPIQAVIGIQVYRVLGVIFLLGWLSGELPSALGLPTALFDLSIGISAPLVGLLAARGLRRFAVLWNVLGLLDFAYSVTLGVLAGPLALIALTPGPELLSALPLSLIVVWAVPLSILLHSIALIKLAQQPAPALRTAAA